MRADALASAFLALILPSIVWTPSRPAAGRPTRPCALSGHVPRGGGLGAPRRLPGRTSRLGRIIGRHPPLASAPAFAFLVLVHRIDNVVLNFISSHLFCGLAPRVVHRISEISGDEAPLALASRTLSSVHRGAVPLLSGEGWMFFSQLVNGWKFPF